MIDVYISVLSEAVMAEEKRIVNLSKQALHRMPFYLQCLKKLAGEGVKTVSAPVVAEMLKLNEVQVRKDFAAVSTSGGRAKVGFDVAELLDSMERTLGYRNVDDAVLVGAGSLGRALASFRGFEEYGLRIVAAFDVDPALMGTTIGQATVYPLEQFTDEMARSSYTVKFDTDFSKTYCEDLWEQVMGE